LDDALNRGHSVALHPEEKKKKKTGFSGLPSVDSELRRERTEAIIDIHESSVLGEFQLLSQHPMRHAGEQ